MWYIAIGAVDSATGGWFPGLTGALLVPRFSKGGLPMVTYADLIQIGILIVGIISLIIQANKKK